MDRIIDNLHAKMNVDRKALTGTAEMDIQGTESGDVIQKLCQNNTGTGASSQI